VGQDGSTRGYGFVRYGTHDEMRAAIKVLQSLTP
jgi:hypothetical protein